MIKLCKILDRMGYYKISDELFNKVITSQFIQPSNNQNVPLSVRMIPWKSIDEDFKQRDKDTYKNDPRFKLLDYITLDGVYEPPYYSADGGTSNLKPQNTKEVNNELIQKLRTVLQYDLTPEERNKVKQQIKQLQEKNQNAEYLTGNEFDMQGPDSVPGPKQIIMDHSSPSQVGLDGFTWKNRRSVHDNASEKYKNLLPN